MEESDRFNDQNIPISGGGPDADGLALLKEDTFGVLPVPQEVLAVTTKCRREFACLKNGGSDFVQGCTVRSALGQDLLAVDPLDDVMSTCSYLTPFGKTHYCSCPTRYHLYQQSGK